MRKGKEKKEKKKNITVVRVICSITLLLTLLTLGFFYFNKNKDVYIDEKTYPISDLHVDSIKKQISYTFLDDDQRFLNDKILSSQLLDIIYKSDDENNYITVERWGKDGKVNTYKPIKIYVNVETYQSFYKTFIWKEKSNL